MSELISDKQAAIAFIDGKQVEFMDETGQWRTVLNNTVLKVFLDRTCFRLKPRTITINGIEAPAPFEPNKDDDCRVYVIDTRNICGWDWQHSSHCKSGHIVWRTEDEIKQVIAALRKCLEALNEHAR